MDDQNIILHMAICSYKSAFLLRWVELDLYRGRHWYIMRLFKGTGALQSILFWSFSLPSFSSPALRTLNYHIFAPKCVPHPHLINGIYDVEQRATKKVKINQALWVCGVLFS